MTAIINREVAGAVEIGQGREAWGIGLTGGWGGGKIEGEMNDPKTGRIEPQSPIIPPRLSDIQQPKGNGLRIYTIAYGIIIGIVAIGLFARFVYLLTNGNRSHNLEITFFDEPYPCGYIGVCGVAVSAGILLSVFKPVPCPKCNGTRRAKRSWKEANSSTFRRGFQVQPIEKCACGHIWQPPTPIWMLIVGIILSLFCIIKFGIQPRLVFYVIIGGVLLVGCVFRLIRNIKNNAYRRSTSSAA